ncbi:MAG: hypothetical protein V2J65_02385 [Desulfobacteraceae bacterium]|nr:hypothetical protein [Desulfobacteraceae bacterium]
MAKTDMGKATGKQHRRRTAVDISHCFGGAKKARSDRNRRII